CIPQVGSLERGYFLLFTGDIQGTPSRFVVNILRSVGSSKLKTDGSRYLNHLPSGRQSARSGINPERNYVIGTSTARNDGLSAFMDPKDFIAPEVVSMR
ncbi:MAG: hypothetical protein ACRD8U_07335, partial [Pyrinomonadaceae bacterium]